MIMRMSQFFFWNKVNFALLRPSTKVFGCPRFFSFSHALFVQKSKDYYKILGVSKDASQKEIKAAYFEAAKRLHPDVAGNTDERNTKQFHDVKEAFDTLGNAEKKTRYDMTYHGYQRQMYRRDRYSHSARKWNRETGGFDSMNRNPADDHFGKEDTTPYTSAEYVTFLYCSIVTVAALYVTYLFW